MARQALVWYVRLHGMGGLAPAGLPTGRQAGCVHRALPWDQRTGMQWPPHACMHACTPGHALQDMRSCARATDCPHSKGACMVRCTRGGCTEECERAFWGGEAYTQVPQAAQQPYVPTAHCSCRQSEQQANVRMWAEACKEASNWRALAPHRAHRHTPCPPSAQL